MRPRRHQSFENLHAPLQRTLRLLQATLILERPDMRSLAWPGGISDQHYSMTLRRWVCDGFLLPTGDHKPYQAFVLGHQGETVLRAAGFAATGHRQPPALVTQRGLILASRCIAALLRESAHERRIGGWSWQCNPWSGAAPRPDGRGAMVYDYDFPLRQEEDGALYPLHLPTGDVGWGQMYVDLWLEIDRGTEGRAALTARAMHWAKYRESLFEDPGRRYFPRVLWLTEGGPRRMNTIWDVWLRHTAAPLFVTSLPRLMINNRMSPFLHGIWFDEHGRTRHLNPFAGNERALRREVSPPPHHATLGAAIRAAQHR